MNPYLVDDEAPTAPAAPAQAALPKAVARNPYLVDEEGETRGHAALAVSLQTEDNPDTAAQHLAIAKRYKTTPDVVARFSPEFKQRIALEMAQQTLASAPKLAARLSNNPQAGALLHDDLPNAAATENAITSLPASPKFTPIADAVGWLFSAPGSKHGLATDAWRILEAANRSVAGTGAWALGAARAVNDMGLQQSPVSGLEQSLRQIATSGAPAEGFWDKVLETAGSTGGVLLEALATGGSSPLPAAGASTVEAISQLVRHGVKAMSIPSAQTATETAQQVLDATGDAAAATKAGLTAYVTTALGGVIPFATPGKLAYRVGSGMVMGPLQAENTRNAMNLALPDDMQRPVPTMEDRSLDVLTGAVFGGFAGPHEGLQAKLHAEAKRTYTEIGQAEAAVRANAGLEALSKLITAGKDRVRDPEGFKQFVADVADSSSVKELYVDAHVLAQALDGAGITGDQLMQTMPDVASQMREGLQADGMVRLPLEDYAAHLAGSKVDDVLRPHLRIDPEGKTFAEAQTFYQGQVDQLTKTAEKILSEKTADDLFSASAKTVHDTLMGDLSTRNAFPAEVNKLYASHARDFFVVLADEMHITPEEAMAKFPLRVNWTDQLPDAGERMSQGYDRDLIVTHNMTADNLLHAKKMGGIPVPSLAVTKKGSPLGGFGEITLVGDSKLADPKGYAGTKVFGADIHSPRYPAVERELDTKKQAALVKQFQPMAEKLGETLPDTSDLQREGQRSLERSPAVIATFLKAQGIEPEVVAQKPSLPPERVARLEKFGLGEFMDTTNLHALLDNKKFIDAAMAEQIAAYEEGGVAGKKPGLMAKMRDDAETRRTFARDTAYAIVAEAKQRANPAPDRYATLSAMEKQIKDGGLGDQFTAYVKDQLDGITKSERIPQGFTNSGNRKYMPHTLENVVKILKKELRGGESFNYGVGSLRAHFTPEFKSLDAIRKAKDKLVSAADFEVVKKEIDAEFSKLRDDLDVSSDALVAILEDTPKMGLERAAKDFDAKLTPETRQAAVDFLNKLRDLPTAYFEAKVMRGVSPSEFKAAVVPHDVDPAALKYLKDSGITDIRTYPRGDEAGRAAAIGQLNHLFFQTAYHGTPHRGIGKFSFNQQPGPQSLGVISLGGFPAKPAVITLLEKANASTYLHELGHFFLETYTHIADSPNAPPKIAKDMQTILDGFGVKDVAAWRAMGLEERRPLHEQWAKSYEAYLMEGKAPTIAQQPMFARFSAWLTKVYTSLQALGVKLTPEVRGVMDRMTGSEKAIAEAEQVRGMEALFKVKPEGMTDEAYESYQALGHDATGAAVASLQQRSLRDMQWLSNAKGRAVRSLQRQARAERVKIREEVEAAVSEVPVYRAEDLLAKGIFNGEKVDTGKTHLDTEALAEMYGGAGADGKSDKYALLDWKPLGKLAGPDGIHPDMAAHMLGFESGDALVKALLEREPRKEMVEAMVDKRMLEEHGELIDPASIERAAEAAIHNDMRTRVLATELTALAKATGSARLLAKAAMEAARAAVDAKRVRDLRPGQYQAAEGRSGRAAMEAFRKGDIPGAATQKRAQLLNNALARTAGDAVNEVQKAVDYLKKFEKESTRGNLPPEYLDQIDKLLERVDLRKLSLKQIDRRAKLASWLKAQEEIGIQPDIPEYLLEDAQLVSYKDMTVDQFRGLRDTVKMIEHLGRLKDKMLTARDNRARAVIFEEMANAITSSRGGATANTREPVTDADRRAAKLLTFGASHIKVATYARVFDGKPGGVVWEYLVRPANERSNWQTERRFELTSKLAEIEKPWHDRKDLNTKREIPGLWKVGAPRSPGAKGSSFTFQELLGIALNTGNEGNLQRLMGGEGWTKEQIDNALAAHLTGDDWARVQQVWDTFETLRPEIGAMERRVFGKEPDWVEPMPSTVRVKSGQPVEVRGGYYPIDYDVRASARAEQHAEAEGAKRQLQGAYGAATVRRGFVKDRAVEVNGRPLSYTLETAHEALEKTIHYLAWQEWLIDANRMLRAGSPVEAAVRETWGPDAIGQIKTWRDAIAEGEGGVQQALGTAAGVVRQNVSLAGIGYNLMSGIVQTTGIAQSWRHIGTPWIAKGVSQYAAHPLAKTAEVHEKSSFMRSRTRTRYRELNELTNAVRGQHEVMRAMRANAYIFTARVQHMVDMPTWLGAYEKQMAEGKPGTPEEVELRAIAVADQAVKDSQGGGQLVDMSAIQRGDKVAKLFTVFYDFANTQFNMVAGDAMRGGAGKAAATALAAVMLPAMLTPLLKDMLTPGNPDAEEDDWPTALRKAAGEGVSSLMNMLVLVRELADAGKWMVSGGKANDYTGPPGLRTFVDLIKFGKQARQAEFDDAFRKAAVNLSGDVFGIPSSQINRTWDGVEALAEGETQNPAALVMGYQKPR